LIVQIDLDTSLGEFAMTMKKNNRVEIPVKESLAGAIQSATLAFV
jgi:hypothetical protein